MRYPPPPKPVLVGLRTEPAIAAALAQLDGRLADAGVRWVSAFELCRMPKAPGQPVAIPHPDLVPRILVTLAEVWMPIRQTFGRPIPTRAYRAPAYNAAVGGKSWTGNRIGSLHMRFAALDLRCFRMSSGERRRLAAIVADVYLQRGADVRMGFGAYGFPAPHAMHIDTGHRRRVWRDAVRIVRRARG